VHIPKVAALLIIGLSCLLAPSALAQTDFAAINPPGVNFGILPVTTAPVAKTFRITIVDGAFAKLRSTRWKSGGTPTNLVISGMPQVGETLTAGTEITVEAAFPLSGYFHEVLQVTLECDDGDFCEPDHPITTLEIPITARVDCLATDANCAPKGPECTIDFNNEWHVYFPSINFTEKTKGVVQQIAQRHYNSTPIYQIPVETLWGIAGLGDMFEAPTSPDCPCKSLLPPMSFSHVSASPLVAQFSWSSSDSKDYVLRSKANPVVPFEVELTLPAKISGQAIIGGSYVELWFSSLGEAPSMKMTYTGSDGTYSQGEVIYDGEFLCTGTARDYATLRHPEAGDRIPNMSLYIADDPVVR